VPFTPWVQGAQWWFGEVLGVIILVIVLALAGAAFALPAMRRMPVELRLWLVAYSLYLLAVFFPQSSTFRLLLPLVPALGAVALGIASVGTGRITEGWSLRVTRVIRVVLAVLVIALGIAGQVAWIHVAWWVDGYDWTPP